MNDKGTAVTPVGSDLTSSRLVARSLVHHWRTNAAVVLGVAVGTSVLTGALFVGDSMRASLRAAALQRLGPVEHALVAQRFFREALAEEVAGSDEAIHAVPLIMLTGSVVHADTSARVDRMNVFGVDDRFWGLSAESRAEIALPMGEARAAPREPSRTVILNDALARELGAKPGDDVLLRLPSQNTVSSETLLGRRDRATLTLRLTVEKVVSSSGPGGFSVTPAHQAPKTAWVPLPTLQRTIQLPARTNAILVALRKNRAGPSPPAHALQTRLDDAAELTDFGLTIRGDSAQGFVLESDRMLLEPAVEEKARAAALAIGAQPNGVLTYLANEITVIRSGETPPEIQGVQAAARSSIPYSTVSAIEELPWRQLLFDEDTDKKRRNPAPEIILNEWVAKELNAKPGDSMEIAYYETREFGRLEVQRARFVLRGVAPISGFAADPTLTPAYPGVTDVENIADWDAPFPIDLKRITPRDEEYWKKHRATPKAFVRHEMGQLLWANDAARFGRLTSLRIPVVDRPPSAPTASTFAIELQRRLDPAEMGLRFQPVREQALAASSGTTDFGGLFLGFSFFLILSAAMLVALLFQLSIERRSAQAGLLLALGLTPRRVTGLFLAEGALLASIGGVIGLSGAFGYAWLMLTGLRTWWSGAVQTSTLILAGSPLSAAIGCAGSFIVAMLSIAVSLRGLAGLSVRSLLQGGGFAPSNRRPSAECNPGAPGAAGNTQLIIAIVAFMGSILTILWSLSAESESATLLFFLSGALLLVSAVAFAGWMLSRPSPRSIEPENVCALARLSARNASRQPGRSRLTVALIASATFLIVALQAFRIDPHRQPVGKSSGTGGYTVFAQSSVPILADLNSADGREVVNVPKAHSETTPDFSVTSFRLSEGDETSCLSLYTPQRPRVLGAPKSMIERGGFAFSRTLAQSPEDKANPWRLLEDESTPSAIPAIGDESAVRWQLHSGVGKQISITDEQGREARLRFVALLKGSALQSELIVSEKNFKRLFPSHSGYSFFLIETTTTGAAAVSAFLEKSLASYGFDAAPVSDRLTAYAAVQNTYLSTFQLLGGLGLILGTLGLTAVMLRNVWERRAELALMQAVGFSRPAIGAVILLENFWLVLAGLAAGFFPALAAIAPHLFQKYAQFPTGPIAAILSAVFLSGMLSGTLALIPTLKTPIVRALRSE